MCILVETFWKIKCNVSASLQNKTFRGDVFLSRGYDHIKDQIWQSIR